MFDCIFGQTMVIFGTILFDIIAQIWYDLHKFRMMHSKYVYQKLKPKEKKIMKNDLTKLYVVGGIVILCFLIITGIVTSSIGGKQDNEPDKEATQTYSEAPQSTSSDTSTSSSDNVAQSESAANTTKKLVKLTADYDGSTEEGTILAKDNSGITVFAGYDDGTELDITDYTIKSPSELKAGKTSTIIITYENVQCKLSVKCTSLTAKQYKQKCKNISYKKLARTPDKYEGKKVKFTGEIVQVMEDEDTSSAVYRINVTKGNYGFWDDTVYVEYWGSSEKRFLEDDIVTFYGESVGLYTYETVLGASVTIPCVNAKYITLNK